MPSQPTAEDTTIIVGGGVVGLSIAWELAQRGRKVAVLESEKIGKGASWAGAGILPAVEKQATTDPYEQLRALSHNLHPIWAERLCRETGLDTGYARCGGIYLATSPGEAATLAANRLWWREHGIEHHAWDHAELARQEPALVAIQPTEIQAAWFLPDECQIRNPRHLQALALVCRKLGVDLIESTRVERIEPLANQRIAIHTRRATLSAQQVCICSGAWARETLEQLGIRSGIMPVRGQMVLYNCDRPVISHIVNEGHRYLVPRRDGRLLAGSIEEEVGYAIQTTEAGLAHIRGWAERVLPAIKNCPIEKSWAGLRPGSFDGWPYVGRVPGFENLFLAAGHFRSGLHLSCATAVVMANTMQGLPNPIDLHPFRVGRG